MPEEEIENRNLDRKDNATVWKLAKYKSRNEDGNKSEVSEVGWRQEDDLREETKE